MKVYTIIDKWEDDGGQMWVANFSTKEEAIKCLRAYLEHYKLCDGDNLKNGSFPKGTVTELFENLLQNGWGYNYYIGSDNGQIFVRGEEVQEKFNEELMPW